MRAAIEAEPGDVAERKKRSFWVMLFSFGLAAVLLYLVLRDLDWNSFWQTIRNGHYEILFAVIPIASANYFVRALRWRIFVGSEKDIPIRSVFWANMIGYMGNAFLPARAGELLRSAFLGQKSGLGTSFVLATALVERLLDALALVLIGSVSLSLQGTMPPSLTNALRVMAIAAVLGLGFVVLLPSRGEALLRLPGRLPIPQAAANKITEQLSRFLVGMRSLQHWQRLLAFVLLTAVIWLVDGTANVIGARLISQTLSLGQALVLLSALGLSSAIPSTPGYVGVFQFVAVLVLMPFGFSKPEALAYILVSQVLNYLLTGILGLLGLWQIRRRTDTS
jgi:uncharacterized protein (TIRG00374 family)